MGWTHVYILFPELPVTWKITANFVNITHAVYIFVLFGGENIPLVYCKMYRV